MKKFLKIFGLIWIVLGIAFFIFIYLSFEAKGFDEKMLLSDSSVVVTESSKAITFFPKKGSKGRIIFYPGALVDPFAYSPLCRKLSEHGYETIIIRMPFRLASQGYNLIKELNLLSVGERTILIGHSQGGKMAAQFLYENPDAIDRLVLLGTTHPRDIDLSSSKIPVLKIFGSEDAIAPVEKIIQNMSKLPEHTEYFKIIGGNHSQFGYYGHQLGDGEAVITRETQIDSVVSKIVDFLGPER